MFVLKLTDERSELFRDFASRWEASRRATWPRYARRRSVRAAVRRAVARGGAVMADTTPFAALRGNDPTVVHIQRTAGMRRRLPSWDEPMSAMVQMEPTGYMSAEITISCPHVSVTGQAFGMRDAQQAVATVGGKEALRRFLALTCRPGGCGHGAWMANVASRLLGECDG